MPASAFHESTADKKSRRFSPARGGLLYMAGVYRPMENEDPEFVIITRAAMRLFHDRGYTGMLPLRIHWEDGRDVPRGLIVPILPAAVFTKEGPLLITGLPVSLPLH